MNDISIASGNCLNTIYVIVIFVLEVVANFGVNAEKLFPKFLFIRIVENLA